MSDVDIETLGWAFDSPAVHREYLPGHGAELVPSMARHPSEPFVVSVSDEGNDIRPLLFQAAGLYLQRVPSLAGLGLSGEAPKTTATFDFGWLPLAWDEPLAGTNEDSRGSFWLRRSVQGQSDRTAVLLASNRILVGDQILGTGESVGLRVVLHVGAEREGRSLVRISGFSTAGLSKSVMAVLTKTPILLAPRDPAGRENTKPDPNAPRGTSIEFEGLIPGLAARAQNTFGFDKLPTVTGVEFDLDAGAKIVRVFGQGEREGLVATRVFAYSARSSEDAGSALVGDSLVEQVTHAVKVFQADPASHDSAASMHTRRTTRSKEILDAYRMKAGPLPTASSGLIVLKYDFVRVLPARVGSELQPPQADPQAVPEANPPPRSDALAAVHAYARGQELLQRFEAYGLAPGSYFKLAKLPLLMRHRDTFASASNGEVVNAHVSPDAQGQSLDQKYDAEARPHLQVGFGSANITHREMLPNNAGQLRAQPLGLAADPRWAWHEFGHVLNFASTGELEFRFAHSAGDALAAIIADPLTQLDAPERIRHLTFPWALLTRSHGRPAHLGWCWCGSRSRLRRAAVAAGAPPMPGGYWEEQLMSSSLFRLYRAVGGDTRSGADPRAHDAADYCVYLIMRAISALGPANVVPARSADQFVSALIDADIGTDRWQVTATWPEGTSRNLLRRGGAVHKVIRWAFEQQGLYATSNVDEVVEGVGQAPKVDIFIPGSGARADGGYEAVDLAWSASSAMPWHVPGNSIFRNGTPDLQVKVGNRGSQLASQVSVQAWVSPVNVSTLNWRPLAGLSMTTRDIGGGGTAVFAFDGSGLVGDFFVLAAASCKADPANADPDAKLPCGESGQASQWTDPKLLTDLVANDNNIGLRIVRFV
jgi:hypothetical protein